MLSASGTSSAGTFSFHASARRGSHPPGVVGYPHTFQPRDSGVPLQGGRAASAPSRTRRRASARLQRAPVILSERDGRRSGRTRVLARRGHRFWRRRVRGRQPLKTSSAVRTQPLAWAPFARFHARAPVDAPPWPLGPVANRLLLLRHAGSRGAAAVGRADARGQYRLLVGAVTGAVAAGLARALVAPGSRLPELDQPALTRLRTHASSERAGKPTRGGGAAAAAAATAAAATS